MSKNGFKKFRKNDFSYDEEESAYDVPRSKVNKREARRVERALRTKDISLLIEEEGLDPLDVEDDIWGDEELQDRNR